MKLIYWIVTIGVFVAAVVSGRRDFEEEISSREGPTSREAPAPRPSPGGNPREKDAEEIEGAGGRSPEGKVEPPPGRPGVETPEAEAVNEARRLLLEARRIYQKAAIDHLEDPKTLHDAKADLEKALEIIFRLPETDAL